MHIIEYVFSAISTKRPYYITSCLYDDYAIITMNIMSILSYLLCIPMYMYEIINNSLIAWSWKYFFLTIILTTKKKTIKCALHTKHILHIAHWMHIWVVLCWCIKELVLLFYALVSHLTQLLINYDDCFRQPHNIKYNSFSLGKKIKAYKGNGNAHFSNKLHIWVTDIHTGNMVEPSGTL